MTLYDSILDHERQGVEVAFEVMARSNPEISELVMEGKEPMIDASLKELKLILNAAQENPDAPLEEGQLEELLTQMSLANIEHFGLVITGPEVRQARKQWTRAVFSYYQQLIKQGDKASCYEEAVRMAFRDRSSHLASLQARIYPEIRVGKLILSKGIGYPMENLVRAEIEATDYVANLELNYFFPQE